ncbi:MAG: hypothetical protein U9N35_05955 [Euryarchaeota archaeon]|nr:hypothetical protein [Euryarchaeota archaeon]
MPAGQFAPSFARVFFSYILYYLVCPGTVVYTAYRAYHYYKKKKKWIKPLFVALIVYFLVIPLWGYALSNLVDARMRNDVRVMKGPYFGTEKTIKEISTEFQRERYKYYEVEQYVRLSDLTTLSITGVYTFPGRWVCYKTTTFYPIPKSKLYLFYVAPNGEVMPQDEITIFFPLIPSWTTGNFFPWTV